MPRSQYMQDYRKRPEVKARANTAEDKRNRALRNTRCDAKKLGHAPPINVPLPPRDGHCDCCLKIPEDPFGRGLHLDHDHKTGEFRGWICRGCNHGIGVLGDDVSGLQNAIAYLQRKLPRQ